MHAVAFAAGAVVIGSFAWYRERRAKPCVGLYLLTFLLVMLAAVS